MPVYYIAGEGDWATPQDEIEAYSEKITAPDKLFVKLDKVGHSLFMDDPKRFCETVKRVLARTQP